MAKRLKNAGRKFSQQLQEAPRIIVNPGFVMRRVERASTIGQWLAAVFMVPFIPAFVFIIRMFHDLLITLFLRGQVKNIDGVPFFVTMATFCGLIFADWLCFQWVRTAGFGMTNVRLRRD